jgi:UDP-N-acetyl-2-amino-2-deoxyglucuronate dehydrogenase
MIKNTVSLDRKIRIAIVGCGRISKKHFESIESHADHLELVSVCDVDENILSANYRKYNLPTYLHLNEMMENEDLDLVVLCTPSGLHAQQTEIIAKHGVNVITEKPMATRWHDGLRMVKACDQAGVRLFVVKQNRRNFTLQLLKNAIEKGRFGRIHMVNVNVFWTRPQEYYDSAQWRGTWEFDGGALMNQASHYVDLLDWLIGPIESLQAYTATLARNIEVEDSGVVSVKWRSGALGSLNVTMLTYPKNLEGSITVLGEKGTVQIGGLAVNEIKHWDFLEAEPEDRDVQNANYETTSVYGLGHPLYYRNVIDTMRGVAEPETDGREGLRSLEILIAAYISSRDGKRVSLPLNY